jgi:hypothetical protein
MKLKSILGSVLLLSMLLGCKEAPKGISHYPLITEDMGAGPWQVVTYSGEKIIHETIQLDGRSVVVRSESVYISNKSQFVYRDGSPITNYKGEYLYWNVDGQVINRELKIISEDQVFIVGGKPMKPNTPIQIRDLHQAAPLATLSGIDKAE